MRVSDLVTGWISTFTGRNVHPLDMTADEIDIQDIAHALSNQCRWGGHTKKFYSVAEHSMRVSFHLHQCHIVRSMQGNDFPRAPLVKSHYETQLWGLLHDAAEAYLVDVPRPIELPRYREWENKILKMISHKFDLSWPIPDEVHAADDVVMVTEYRDLMTPNEALAKKMKDTATPFAAVIKPYHPGDAKIAFLKQFEFLVEARKKASAGGD